ncbi:MAG: hypothetical protein M1840_002836 [Geoglossum simile]|nr:MAG: hypothetical protein M1840_002836 [Geoglossum simile]
MEFVEQWGVKRRNIHTEPCSDNPRVKLTLSTESHWRTYLFIKHPQHNVAPTLLTPLNSSVQQQLTLIIPRTSRSLSAPMHIPFPYPISIGIDICRIRRVYDLISKDRGKWRGPFLRKVFNPRELRLLGSTLRAKQLSLTSACPRQTWGLAQFLAGRWAAKEAAIKAIRSRRVRFHEITVESKKGLPHMLIDLPEAHATEENTTGEAATRQVIGGMEDEAEEEGAEVGTFEAKLSISHDGAYATAIVMAIDEPPKP